MHQGFMQGKKFNLQRSPNFLQRLFFYFLYRFLLVNRIFNTNNLIEDHFQKIVFVYYSKEVVPHFKTCKT